MEERDDELDYVPATTMTARGKAYRIELLKEEFASQQKAFRKDVNTAQHSLLIHPIYRYYKMLRIVLTLE